MSASEAAGKRLLVDVEKCIGCLACANVCPEKLVSVEDDEDLRILRFATICTEADCKRCADCCPEGALSFGREAETIAPEQLVLTFELARCRQCGKPFTSQKLVDRIAPAVSKSLHAKLEELGWIFLCPDCRKSLGGEKLARAAGWMRSGFTG